MKNNIGDFILKIEDKVMNQIRNELGDVIPKLINEVKIHDRIELSLTNKLLSLKLSLNDILPILHTMREKNFKILPELDSYLLSKCNSLDLSNLRTVRNSVFGKNTNFIRLYLQKFFTAVKDENDVYNDVLDVYDDIIMDKGIDELIRVDLFLQIMDEQGFKIFPELKEKLLSLCENLDLSILRKVRDRAFGKDVDFKFIYLKKIMKDTLDSNDYEYVLENVLDIDNIITDLKEVMHDFSKKSLELFSLFSEKLQWFHENYFNTLENYSETKSSVKLLYKIVNNEGLQKYYKKYLQGGYPSEFSKLKELSEHCLKLDQLLLQQPKDLDTFRGIMTNIISFLNTYLNQEEYELLRFDYLIKVVQFMIDKNWIGEEIKNYNIIVQEMKGMYDSIKELSEASQV